MTSLWRLDFAKEDISVEVGFNHGEAVAIGMLVAAGISIRLGLIGKGPAARIESLIRRTGLPTTFRSLRLVDVYGAHLHDKKFTGKTNCFIVPLSIGHATLVRNVPSALIRAAIQERTCDRIWRSSAT